MCSNNRKIWGVKNLRLAFPKKKTMLFKDLSFQYRKGEKLLLLGPSGCGKSTLLHVLSGIVPNCMELPMHAESLSVPESRGYVFQDPETQFCMPYADEEIAFALENRRVPREQMPRRIADYLAMVDLKLADTHQLIRTLSGGMKQRLAIAGILALEPEVMFLDEPTALLDPQGTELLWQTVRRIGQDRTLIIVEHKIDHVLDFIERVVLFNHQGEIFADGPKDEMIEKYRDKLDAYGIWHSGSWKGYGGKRAFPGSAPARVLKEKILEWDGGQVLRQKQIKFTAEKLTICRGEWVAIVGKNGAGKSTMIEGMMGLLRTKGHIRWSFIHPEDHVQFVFQNPEYQFITDSVADELAFGLRIQKIDEQEIMQRVEQQLQRYALEKQRHQHPFQLSTGQKRRLSVAAAMITHPDVLILDEPTFGQDARNTFALLDLLSRLQQEGTTIIMVTHELEIVRRFATHVLVVDHGRLVRDSLIPADGEEIRDGHDFSGKEQIIF